MPTSPLSAGTVRDIAERHLRRTLRARLCHRLVSVRGREHPGEQPHPAVQVELATDEGYVDIVERGFDTGVRRGESVQKDMVAVPLGGPITLAIVGSPDYFKRNPVPRNPSDLVHHNCVRFRFSGSGAIYKWQLVVDGRLVEYEIGGNLTIGDSLFTVEAAPDGIGLAYTLEQLVLPHIRTKKLKRVLTSLSPTFPGVLPVLPEQAAAAFQVESLRGVCAGAFAQELRLLERQRPSR